jgi:hypothetical protein
MEIKNDWVPQAELIANAGMLNLTKTDFSFVNRLTRFGGQLSSPVRSSFFLWVLRGLALKINAKSLINAWS